MMMAIEETCSLIVLTLSETKGKVCGIICAESLYFQT
jgi:hypothetical protein